MKEILSQVLPILSLVPGARPYALTDFSTQQYAAVFAAKAEITKGKSGWSHGEMAAWLSKEMRPYLLPEVWQQKPVVDEIPKPGIDPVTGLAVPNPFDKPTWHLPSQVRVKADEPILAAHWESIANGGLNYEFLATFNQKREQAKAVIDYAYNESSHAANPWRSNKYAVQQKVRDTNPMLADFLQAEAKSLSAIHSFGPLHANLSGQGVVQKANPEAAALLRRAAQIHKSWLQEAIDSSAEQERRFAEQKRQAEAQLLGRR